MNNTIKVEFPALPENERLARMICAAFVLELDPTVEEMSEIKTAVSEAVTNSVIHGYGGNGGRIEIEGSLTEDSVSFVIKDFGCGIEDIDRAREPLWSGSGDPERSGMGFSIMEAFMDELSVESTSGKGTVIEMTKRLGGDGR